MTKSQWELPRYISRGKVQDDTHFPAQLEAANVTTRSGAICVTLPELEPKFRALSAERTSVGVALLGQGHSVV